MTRPKDLLELVEDSIGLSLLEEAVSRSERFFLVDKDKEKCDIYIFLKRPPAWSQDRNPCRFSS